MSVPCHVCGSTILKKHAVQVWLHPKDGSPPRKVWLCQFCKDLVENEQEEL